MRKLVLLLLSPTFAWAQSYPTPVFGVHGSTIYVKLAADGVTDDSVALAAAATTCTGVGGTIKLPAGTILLAGAAQIRLANCSMEGTGATGVHSPGHVGGTVLALTSTTVQPIVLGASFEISDITFYWPNQTTGATVYPSALGDAGASTGFGPGVIDNVYVINGYDFLAQSKGGNSGDIRISNSNIWVSHDAFRLRSTGDSWTFSNVRFTPNGWLGFSGSKVETAIINAVTGKTQPNTIFHIASGSGVTFVANSMQTYAWRYGILIDSDAVMGGSEINASWDGMGTLVDSSSNGNFFANQFYGEESICGQSVYGGGNQTTPCFNLGTTGYFTLSGFLIGGGEGDIFHTAGASIIMVGGTVSNCGHINNGSDYYLVKFTGNNNTNIQFQDNQLTGSVGSSPCHGFYSASAAPSQLLIQNNSWLYFKDEIISPYPSGVGVISGNVARSTRAAAGVSFSGSPSKMSMTGNDWDTSVFGTQSAIPIASLPACSSSFAGQRQYVNNASQSLTAGIGAVVAPGGSNVVPVGCDGKNWRIGG